MRRNLIVTAVILCLAAPARAETGLRLVPPVDAPISAAFVAPASDFGAGHRGIDYSVPVGTRVRSAAPGTVAFSGSVAGVLAVAIDHGAGIETTYTGLSRIDVEDGDHVDEGRFVGATGEVHGEPALHFGVKLHGTYVDPNELLVPLDVAGAIHLAPLEWMPDQLGALGAPLAPPRSVGTSRPACRPIQPVTRPARPPNDNIVVAVAGITSKTRGGISADIYESGPELLGYAGDSTYYFSYAGTDGPDLHQPYDREDTYVDIRTAARRLRALMSEISRRHPGREVDLIAHSQGGIVARTYLTQASRTGDALPVVEHLVTYASPHRGAPGAGQVAPLRDGTFTGRYVLEAAKGLSASGLPIPDPSSPAVGQLAPGSELMNSLAREDTAYGTRVLTLAIPNDPVVPADRAFIAGQPSRIVPWTAKDPTRPSLLAPPASQAARFIASNLGGHSAIVTSPVAHGIAYSFLADHPLTCPTSWDDVGRDIGSVFSTLESSMASVYGALERSVPGAALPLMMQGTRRETTRTR
ncbi:MAG: peptidoglycan DD-metalloendopeptidase family protein [Actinobacteria bacterium]|nr:peptidoglycan DD-metalloendopeptidase family protein [Actinomycetota bacterium]